MRWLFLSLGLSSRFGPRPALPPVGGSYEQNLTLPFLGKQNIRLHILSRKTAALEMHGALDLTPPEELQYRPTDTHTLSFDLGPRTKRLLKRTRTVMRGASYDSVRDRAHVHVKPPLVSLTQVVLERMR